MALKILLIDDDRIVNFINSRLVEFEFPGIPYKVFENGLQAFDYIVENNKTPYLVFLDINMPVMNGWKFLDAVSPYQEEFDLQIHILTSSVDKNDKVKANQYKQVHSILHKPLTKTKLAELTKEFLKP